MMFRSIVLHDIPMDAIATMERWYWAAHSPEIARRYGPWSARHDSWLPIDTPADARGYGYYNWRLTEGWWRTLPDAGPKGALSFTPPPVWPTVAACFTPWQPSEDFKGWENIPDQLAPVRWYMLLRFPDAAKAAAETWFVHDLAPTVSRFDSVSRFFSYRTVHPGHLPGTWAPDAHPPQGSFSPNWDRVCEFWFRSFSDWRRFMAQGQIEISRPGWASTDAFPYLVPHSELVSTFLLERPTDRFLTNPQVYV